MSDLTPADSARIANEIIVAAVRDPETRARIRQAIEREDSMNTTNKTHDGLPVSGYRAQGADRVALVNANKEAEERALRLLDHLAQDPDTDKRWLAIGRTQLEQGWMAVNRAVFQPGRVRLPEDEGRAA